MQIFLSKTLSHLYDPKISLYLCLNMYTFMIKLYSHRNIYIYMHMNTKVNSPF